MCPAHAGLPEKRLVSLCVGCGNQIHDQYILRVSPDLEWHAACLKCAECSQYLDESCTCFVRDGKTYCKRDYIRQDGRDGTGRLLSDSLQDRSWSCTAIGFFISFNILQYQIENIRIDLSHMEPCFQWVNGLKKMIIVIFTATYCTQCILIRHVSISLSCVFIRCVLKTMHIRPIQLNY